MHSLDLISKIVTYNPDTGAFTYLNVTEDMFPGAKYPHVICASWNARFSGRPAFSVTGQGGYLYGSILGARYLAHRVAWGLHTGSWPINCIDHVNGDPSDNRIGNLREATHSQNQHNRVAYKNNTSGYKGVSWNKGACKWQASIRLRGKLRNLGMFNCPKEAHAAYCRAAKELHGEFANGG